MFKKLKVCRSFGTGEIIEALSSSDDDDGKVLELSSQTEQNLSDCSKEI
jgi:hypothetical protein